MSPTPAPLPHQPQHPRRDATRGLGFAAIIAFASISPLCTDFYTPALPQVVREFSTSAAAVQLTLTGFMVGMAVGQLVVGTLSDILGRRRLLLLGGLLCALATVGCALAPTIEVFIAARVLQGLAGAAGVVLARAIVSDSTQGSRTGRLIGLMVTISGAAPVIAPLFGAVIIEQIGWRGAFWALASVVGLATLAALLRVPETLPPAKRNGKGVSTMARNIRVAVTRRRFVGLLATFSFAFGAFFSYISASSFILQNQHGFSPLGYGLVFAGCAATMMASAAVTSALAGKVPYERLLSVGLIGLVGSSALLAVAAFTGTPLWLYLTGCVLLTASMGQIMANTTTLAITQVRDLAGTGSALLGTVQFGMGAVVAPLVGLGGEHDSRAFGVVVIVWALIAAGAFFGVARRAPDLSS